MAESTLVLVGTRKGAWIISAGSTRSRWSVKGPLQLGTIVYHFLADPRDTDHMLMALGGGPLGATVIRSNNQGKTWHEAARPPAFAGEDSTAGQSGRTVDHVFWLTPGRVRWPGVSQNT